MATRLNPQFDPVQLRKRVLLFYFAAGVNLLMAFWVGAAAGATAGAGAVSLVTLVFIGFAGVNYYMARKLQKYLRRVLQERGAAAVPVDDKK